MQKSKFKIITLAQLATLGVYAKMLSVKHKSSGFTLIELLVVILVIFSVGVLIASVLFSALRGANKTNTIDTVRRNGNSAITQMSRMIRYSQSFDGISVSGSEDSYTKSCVSLAAIPPPMVSVPSFRLGLFSKLASLIQGFGNLGEREVSSLFSKISKDPKTVFAAGSYSTAVQAIAGLKAYWRMGEASGNLTDTTANANTMTAFGTPTYSVAGAISGDTNTAISLPQASATYFQAPNSASLNVADTFSIVAWIKITTIGAHQMIISRPIDGYDFRVDATGHLSLVKTWVSIIVTSTTTMATGSYHMVAVTKNGATVKLYIDGMDRTGVVSNRTISANGSVTQIGRNAHDTLDPFGGSIDEVALWNVALTAGDISTLYSTGTAPNPTPTLTPTPTPTPTPTQYHYARVTGFDGGQTTFSCDTSGIASNSASLIDTSSVDVSSCYFTCTQSDTFFPPNIGINFTLTQKGNPQFFENKASATFQTSVSVRNY